ncbi:MAG: hypothetical protein ACJ8C4_08450 [Gemmataceae bacterium]
MTFSLLAILELERDPLRLDQLKDQFLSWIQGAGGFAGVGLIFLIVASFRKSDSSMAGDRTRSRLLPWVILCASLAIVAYVAAGVLYGMDPPQYIEKAPNAGAPPPPPISNIQIWRERMMALGGALSIIGIALPFLADLLRVRLGRVWALAKLSFKEAVRRRVLWVFLAFLLVFLFPPKWFKSGKPENDVRDAVAVIEFANFAIMMMAFSLLAAFSIPNDLRLQTMHTIVTKPVERFEIVLGRFLGYAGLATIVLFGLRLIAVLLIVASHPSEEAQFESFQAREPVYGELEFFSKRGDFRGDDVGREWTYRKYIGGGPNSPQRANFKFNDIPAKFANDPFVPVEFSFDIFRTHKGEEGKGVQASLFFSTADWDGSPAKQAAYVEELRKLNLNPNRNLAPDDPNWAKWSQVAEKFGYYEFRGKEIANFHTFRVLVPGGLFKHALETSPTNPKVPRLLVSVKCESRSQFLGVAKWDVYLLAGEHSFIWNFVKGGMGLWLMLCLAIGIAVTCSTCLSGVVSWLATAFIIGAGFFREFIAELAEGRAVGGGPMESFIKLVGNQNLISDLPQSPGKTIATIGDKFFEWVFQRVLNLVPDVERFDWSNHVAEGFNIPGTEIGLTVLVLFAYLLPWAVLAYYLMKSREVAN